jgi:hypothetical protein
MEMEKIMENFHLETDKQNQVEKLIYSEVPNGSSQSKVTPTLQPEVSTKNQIIITADELREVTWLFKQYGMLKPGWLRQRFVINQRRKKALNDVLRESGMEGLWCGKLCKTDDWVAQLHGVWHLVNGRPSCI